MEIRYSRQELFKPIGKAGQQKLMQQSVTIIGCGALGSAIAETLVRAGIGNLILVDRDYVEFSNLQRQQLFSEQDAEEMLPKVVAAEKRLRMLRSDVQLEIYIEHADSILIEELATKSNLIIDATDNFETRLVINDVAHKCHVPWIYGACVGSTGVVFPFVPGRTACFRCLLPVLPSLNETCDTAGIIAPAVQVTAAVQTAEALKILIGNYDALLQKIHHFDLWNHTRMDIGISRLQQEHCKTCGTHPTYPSLSVSEQMKLTVLCGRDTVQVLPDRRREISLDDAERAGQRFGAFVKRTPYFVEIKSVEHRLILFTNGRLLIHGANNIATGRKIYHQLFG